MASGINYIDLHKQLESIGYDQMSASLQKVLDHLQCIGGPEVVQLESALAQFVGVSQVVSCSSGTSALSLALMALEVKPGDEVIMPAFSFFATCEVVLLLGATPVFVDIDPQTFNIDPDLIEAAITDKTKAVISVDLYGLPADFDRIELVCARHALPLINDAAQSFGSTYNGGSPLARGTLATTSFFPSKPLGAYGDAGAVFTSHEDLADKMRMIANHGQEGRYRHTMLGFNARMDSFQAAVLLQKLRILPDELIKRDQVATAYTERLSGYYHCPAHFDGYQSAWAQYTLRVPQRDSLVDALTANNIPSSVHYPCGMHQQPVVSHYVDKQYCLPHTEQAALEVLSLPFHPYLTEAEIDTVCQSLLLAVSDSVEALA